MKTYTVKTCDVCAEGFERLRNQNEFILLAYPRSGDTWQEIQAELVRDIQNCSFADQEGFDFDSARSAVSAYCATNAAWLQSECDSAEVGADLKDEFGGLTLFMYVEATQ